jgi:hypothetical protein
MTAEIRCMPDDRIVFPLKNRLTASIPTAMTIFLSQAATKICLPRVTFQALILSAGGIYRKPDFPGRREDPVPSLVPGQCCVELENQSSDEAPRFQLFLHLLMREKHAPGWHDACEYCIPMIVAGSSGSGNVASAVGNLLMLYVSKLGPTRLSRCSWPPSSNQRNGKMLKYPGANPPRLSEAVYGSQLSKMREYQCQTKLKTTAAA